MKLRHVFALFVVSWFNMSGIAQAEKRTTVQDLMQRKLASAQALLQGLALEDFKSILTNTKELKAIATAATWHKSTDPDFLHYAKSFSNALDNMEEQATAKNLEGVAMSYIGLTFSCMQCHNAVREGRKP